MFNSSKTFTPQQSSDKKKVNQALWGKLACEILTQNMVTAAEDLLRIVAGIESEEGASHSEKLGQRAWVLHWALFVYFNTPKGGREGMCFLVQNCILWAMQI